MSKYLPRLRRGKKGTIAERLFRFFPNIQDGFQLFKIYFPIIQVSQCDFAPGSCYRPPICASWNPAEWYVPVLTDVYVPELTDWYIPVLTDSYVPVLND